MSNRENTVRGDYAILLFRVFQSFIFIVAGLKHLLAPASVTERLMGIPIGQLLAGYVYPEPLVMLSGAGLLLGGLALLVGLLTRKAALGLICILIPITLTVQTQGMHTSGPFFKNIGLLGGLIYFAAHGGGRYAFDYNLKSIKSF